MSVNSRLLTSFEVLDYHPETIKESVEKTGKIFLKGVMQKADTLNQNGRVYPKAILEREVRNYQKLINENRALGECDHPSDSVVNLKNASHIVREAYMDGNNVFGTIEILDKTPSGAILKGLIESGVKLGISSRGVGSTVKQGDYYMVQDDYILLCWDMVSDPSTSGAFMLPEGKYINGNYKSFLSKSDYIDRALNDILS